MANKYVQKDGFGERRKRPRGMQDTSDMEPVNRAARRAIASNRKNVAAKTDITKWQRRK